MEISITHFVINDPCQTKKLKQRTEVVFMYETKVILTLLAEKAAEAKTTKEIFNAIRNAAGAEGMKLPTFDEMKKKLEEDNKEVGVSNE